jgi:outer membrane protein TolC
MRNERVRVQAYGINIKHFPRKGEKIINMKIIGNQIVTQCFHWVVFLAIFPSMLLSTSYVFASTPTLAITMVEAEHLVLTNAPELQSLQATKNALQQQSIADGQLPDPQLMIGAINVPTNNFSFTQDEMTMVQVGLQQTFLPGHSLKYKSQKTQDLAIATAKKQQAESLDLLRKVRASWLDLYYWTHSKQIFNKTIVLHQYLLKAVESQYSVGKANQSDVLQVQLELARLQDQRIQILQQIDVARASLGRWIGDDNASRPIANLLPQWLNPPTLSALTTQIQQHPLLKEDAAKIDAAQDEVGYAKEQYKPGWTLQADYGIRQGEMMNGMSRSDMITVQATVDLPFFTSKRQSKRLAASYDELLATQMDRQTHYRDLSKDLHDQYVNWQRLSQRDMLYQQQLIPESSQNAKAALESYASALTDLTAVLRAYSNELNARMELLQIQMARAKARVNLLYLEGVIQ